MPLARLLRSPEMRRNTIDNSSRRNGTRASIPPRNAHFRPWFSLCRSRHPGSYIILFWYGQKRTKKPLTGRAHGGTACFCLSPVGWPSQDAPTGTRRTRRVDATTAATANQKPWRAVVCGPQFQASGRLRRTALGVASQPLLATQKWQGETLAIHVPGGIQACRRDFYPRLLRPDPGRW
ncbi:hypothetical protein Selin_0515 [Desulfurispirillum indicum S5]|uniref:Uncharacterized protein n=1 Tax=Desulfurispirillum indicum (strain ATCC BAA-1389 / DSM 22839 / S5) TaxID=653733 RepID=E6W0L1_DESIS|nr:hypothetical protein Selin_0515 [Desulfurispirillum indicum S5]